jgi:hypothetical protein
VVITGGLITGLRMPQLRWLVFIALTLTALFGLWLIPSSPGIEEQWQKYHDSTNSETSQACDAGRLTGGQFLPEFVSIRVHSWFPN